MKPFRFLFAALLGLTCALPLSAADPTAKTRVLVVTGGHEFEKAQFFKIFEDNPNITFRAVEHPNACEWFKAEHAGEYDVVVLYDMEQEITPQAQQDFIDLIKGGKGLVALHHSICGYDNWPEYEKILGGKYHHAAWTENGAQHPASTFLHGVDFQIKVSPVAHPVTRGVKDYAIHDETYGGMSVNSDVTPLLTTDERTSSKTIGWAKTYGKARVVFLQSGHDHIAYENPNVRRLIAQAIEWTAGK